FFKAEDGIRYRNVTGVQTCALPICFCFLIIVIYWLFFWLFFFCRSFCFYGFIVILVSCLLLCRFITCIFFFSWLLLFRSLLISLCCLFCISHPVIGWLTIFNI